ncbi:hypothetical protein ACFFK0_22735 [Paenibacillus chartarius]|uniref:Uncharacterized protein n=1 Tax=Paenibacillus chartarius TaxID=747481 RepID=A0ABV6DRE0_9BACL
MQRIYPITEEACRCHCGKPVLIYLADGSEVYGMLSRVENGKLVLNEPETAAEASGKSVTTSQRKSSARSGKKTRGRYPTVQTSAFGAFPGPFFPPFGLLGPVLAFDLAFIAALFLLI